MIIRGEPIEDYHANPATSKSGLVTFIDSPRAFHEQWVRGIRPSPTDAQILGIATDLWVTEGEARFRQAVAVEPPIDEFPREWFTQPKKGEGSPSRSSAGYQAWKAEQAQAGRPIVTQDYVETIRDQVEAIREVPELEELIGLAEAQVTLRATEPTTMELVQSRPDFLILEGPARYDFAPVSIDLKTTSDLRRFARWEIMDRAYHLQQAFVRLAGAGCDDLDTREMRHGVLAATKERPCRAELFWLSADLVTNAMAEARHWLAKLAECRRTDTWPRSHHPVRTYECPTYYAATWSGEVPADDALAAAGIDW